MSANTPNRNEIENLILTYFLNCPFCKAQEMEFTWGHLVPKRIECKNCSAAWEPLMSYDGSWSFTAAKLVAWGETKKGRNLMNRMYSAEFWKKMSTSSLIQKEKGSEKIMKMTPEEPARTIIIREIVKLRCPYCGGLYDEVKDRCPYCGGTR